MDDFKFEFNGNKATIVRSDCSGTVLIPSTTYHKRKAYAVTRIGVGAFEGSNSLTSVYIPDSVRCIEDHAFGACQNLSVISIPEGLEITDSVFASELYATSEDKLEIHIPTIIHRLKYDIDNIWYELDDTTATVTRANDSSIITIPPTVAYKGKNYDVTRIGSYAFFRLVNLKSVVIPNCVTSIERRAFRSCMSLASIVIPDSVEKIDEGIFDNCESLESIVVAGGNAHYDSRDNCNAIIETSTNTLVAGCRNTIIPVGVRNIGNDAFYGCTRMKSIDIPDSVTSIGDYAFAGCTELESVVIPNSVISIGNSVFCNCSGLTTVVISNSITNIDDSAFSGCTSLTSIILPNSVVSIGRESFNGCSRLKSIRIPKSVDSIEEYALNCGNLESIIVSSDNAHYDSRDNCNAVIETSSNKLIAGCQNTIIPDSITCIGSHAFNDCKNLKSIEIPNSVVRIEDFAFHNCPNLSTISVPPELEITDKVFKSTLDDFWKEMLKEEKISIPAIIRRKSD